MEKADKHLLVVRTIEQTLKEFNLNDYISVNPNKTVNSPMWIDVHQPFIRATISFNVNNMEIFYEKVKNIVSFELMVKLFTVHEIGHFEDENLLKEWRYAQNKMIDIQLALTNNNNHKKLVDDINRYQKTLLRYENRAWRIGKNKIQDKQELIYYNYLKSMCINEYIEHGEKILKEAKKLELNHV